MHNVFPSAGIGAYRYKFMNENNIEVEFRAEILPPDLEKIKRQLGKLGTLSSKTKRLSFMCFGNVGTKKIDIRVRTTNGACEVVVKSGSFGAHDRIEIAQDIVPAQFLGMVKVFSQFGFTMKLGERETFNYALPSSITVSLVSAGPIAYVEIEKMSSKQDVELNKRKLQGLADLLQLQLLESEERFNELCDRLSKGVDRPFRGTNEDYGKLSGLLKKYTNK